jgi:hypothetical protein
MRRIGCALDLVVWVLAIGGGMRLTMETIQFGLSPLSLIAAPPSVALPAPPRWASPVPSRHAPDGCNPPLEPSSASIRWIEINRASKHHEIDGTILKDLGGELARRRIEILPAVIGNDGIGLRLGHIRPDGPVAAAGFQSGDVVERVNGVNLASPDKALRAYTELKHADGVVFVVLRAGCPVSLQVTLGPSATGIRSRPATSRQFR